MSQKLSPEMQRAMERAKANGGKMVRSPGGFWGRNEFGWFGTSTIQALVSRGVAEYSDWKDRKVGGGRFPIEITIKLPEATGNNSSGIDERSERPLLDRKP